MGVLIVFIVLKSSHSAATRVLELVKALAMHLNSYTGPGQAELGDYNMQGRLADILWRLGGSHRDEGLLWLRKHGQWLDEAPERVANCDHIADYREYVEDEPNKSRRTRLIKEVTRLVTIALL